MSAAPAAPEEKRKDKTPPSAAAVEKNKVAPRKSGLAWGKPGMDDLNVAGPALDQNDPNYDSDGDAPGGYQPEHYEPDATVREHFEATIENMGLFKKKLSLAAKEYFTNFDKDEFTRCLDEVEQSVFYHQVPVRLFVESLSRDVDLLKKIPLLLLYLVEKERLNKTHIAHGFRTIFNRLGDLSLDCPDVDQRAFQITESSVKLEILDAKQAERLEKGAKVARDSKTMEAVKKKAKEIAAEYFDSQDIAEARRSIQEIESDIFHHEVVKTIVSLSLDRSNRERELTSYLLATLTHDVLDSSEVEKAFEILLERVDDLFVDVPNVFQYMSCFVARAISDEALPPAFLSSANVFEGDMGYQVVKQADLLLRKKNASARLAHAWGPGDGRSVFQLKRDVSQLIDEFFESGDMVNAKQCILELNAPLFHHELVKRMVTRAAEKSDREMKLTIDLLQALLTEQTLSARQLDMGYKRIEKGMTDWKLDFPDAPAVFEQIKKAVPVPN